MSLPTAAAIVEAADHLPRGATLTVDQVSWDDYERFLESRGDRPDLRVTYDCGTLEIMSPSNRHGRFERFIDRLVLASCEVLGLTVEEYGNSTWRRRSLAKGIEPDNAYYIRNVQRVIGKQELDLETDAPPDIVAEVDITRRSLSKLSIHAALGVPEVWHYSREACRFYRLAGDRHVEIEASCFLQGLTPRMIAEAIELSETKGQDEACRVFRARLQDLASI